ncbi:MAG: hypothetical protein LCH86_06190 [Proteobacteria bacterium]|nr:hypothetical protein [Pseudomonadota bacterium]
MKITREQRDAWAEKSAMGPFNLWLNGLVKADGVLNLDNLYEVALRYGIEQPNRYEHLNPGQQRMIIGSMLRKRVPEKIYAAPSHSTSQTRQPEVALRPDYIRHASVRDLLLMQAEVLNELRDRQIVRTSNSPLGDYAELLFATAFGWDLRNNSSDGYDAVDAAGMRYQIKSRRITSWNASRQLSALRRLPEANFDILAAVLFDESFRVMKAVLVPHAIVLAGAKRVEHTNSWRFLLHDRVWAAQGAYDVTQEIEAAAAKI